MWRALRLGLVVVGAAVVAIGLAQSEQTRKLAVVLLGLVIGFVGLVSTLITDSVLRYRASRKRCPRCSETVRADARICRYCGHTF